MKVSYSMLNALGYSEGVGEDPRLARATTAEELRRLRQEKDAGHLAQKSRLFKAIQYLREQGFLVEPAASTIRKVVMQSMDGVEAFATSRGEAIVGHRVVERFFNG